MTFADRMLPGPGGPVAISDAEWRSAMLRCLIGIGQDLGIQTMAEGVETLEQLRVLDELGCDCGQGYLFGQPMHPSDVLKFIHDWPADRERMASHADDDRPSPALSKTA